MKLRIATSPKPATKSKTEITSVDDYIAAQPEAARAALAQVRRAIRNALGRRAEETIAYKMPTYKLGGKTVIQFAAWKTHVALYAATRPLLAKFRTALAPYEIAKGTIRFPLAQKMPAKLIADIARFRMRETVGVGNVE